MVVILLLMIAAGMVGLMFYFAIMTDSLFGGCDLATNASTITKVAEIIKAKKGNFYDLGSARGDFLLKLIKKAPSINYYGLDNSWFRIWISRLKALILGRNITFLQKNIFDANLSSADFVYIYLPRELMPGLQTRLQKELKPGAVVLTNRVSFPDWKPKESHNLSNSEKLFMYVKE